MLIAPEIPQLYPTPLIEGLGGSSDSDELSDPFLSGSYTMFPTPLVCGFENPMGVATRFFAGTDTPYPTPQLRGFVDPPGLGKTHYEARLNGQTSANTTQTPMSALTLTLEDAAISNSTWYLLVACELNQGSDYDVAVRGRIRNTTSGTDLTPISLDPPILAAISSYWFPFNAVIPMVFGASPGDQTISVDYWINTGTDEARLRDVTMVAIKKGGNDVVHSDTSSTSSPPSGSSFATKNTATATAAGDYLLIASGVYAVTVNSKRPITQFLVTGTGAGTYLNLTNSPNDDPADRIPQVFMKKLTLGVGSVVNFQFRCNFNDNGVSLSDSHLILLDLSRFGHVESVEDLTDRTTTSSSYVERNAASTTSVTADVDQATYLIIGHGMWNGAGVTSVVGLKGLIDGVAPQEENTFGGTNYGSTYLSLKCGALASGSHTLRHEIKSNGSTTLHSAWAGWVFIRLATP